MCTACVTNILLITISVSSSSGLTGVALKKLCGKPNRGHRPAKAADEQGANRNNRHLRAILANGLRLAGSLGWKDEMAGSNGRSGETGIENTVRN
jgi:hypothetical protein